MKTIIIVSINQSNPSRRMILLKSFLFLRRSNFQFIVGFGPIIIRTSTRMDSRYYTFARGRESFSPLSKDFSLDIYMYLENLIARTRETVEKVVVDERTTSCHVFEELAGVSFRGGRRKARSRSGSTTCGFNGFLAYDT